MLTRKNFFLLGLAAIVGVSVWLYFTYRGVKSTQDALVEQAARIRPPRIPASVPPSMPADTKATSATKARLQLEVVRIQEELVRENSRLEEQRLALESLLAKQTEDAQAPTVDTFVTELQDNRTELSQFVSDLNTNARLRDEVNRQADQLLREQSSQAQLIRAQIDGRIQTQEELVRQTQNELIFWKENSNDLTQQQSRIAELTQALATAQEQLEVLRSEKLLLSAQVLESTRSLQAAKAQALSDLDEDREGLIGDMTLLRSEIRRLQEQVYQTSTQNFSIRREIQRQQKSVQEQQEKVRQLESSLLESNAALNKLE